MSTKSAEYWKTYNKRPARQEYLRSEAVRSKQAEYRVQHREDIREYHRKRYLAMRPATVSPYTKEWTTLQKLKPAEGQVCENYGCTALDVVRDHDHKTKRFRGWLCRRCNAAEGLLLSDPQRMRGLADYAEKHADTHAWQSVIQEGICVLYYEVTDGEIIPVDLPC